MEITGNDGDDIAIGIDLGTTYCAVAVCINGKVEIVPNFNQGIKLTPSYVCYPENGYQTYGKVAKNYAYKFPENTVFDAKRMIGRQWDDPILQEDISRWPFDVVNDNDTPMIKTGTKNRYPQEVSAKLLSAFCRHAEQRLEKEPGSIKKAVITVPAYFNESQRRATIEAGEGAGIEVLAILNEPTAAAIAYRFERRVQEPKTVLIYDFGGGTFDVSIVRVTNDKVETLGVDGDAHLGGEDIDELLVKYCAKMFQNETGEDVLKNRRQRNRQFTRLKLQCEQAKQSLSTCKSIPVDVQSFCNDQDLTVDITRKKFDELITPLVDETLVIMERVIENVSKLGITSKDDIDEIVLVGGSTRIPLVQNRLKEYFGKPSNCSINPDEAVAYGAAVHAALCNSDSNEGESSLSVVDVTPMSIGWETFNGGMVVVIPKNTVIPCQKKEEWRTLYDNQVAVKFRIYQGEEAFAEYNDFLGAFTLKGLTPKPAEAERGDMVMEINKNGVLNMTATSQSNNEKKTLTVADYRKRMDKTTMDDLIKDLITSFNDVLETTL